MRPRFVAPNRQAPIVAPAIIPFGQPELWQQRASLNRRIERVEAQLDDWVAEADRHQARNKGKIDQMRSSLYGVALELIADHESLKQFLAARRVEPRRGRPAGNQFQVIVKAFAKRLPDDHAYTVTKLAQAFAYAHMRNVQPDQLAEFIDRNQGVQGCVKAYRASVRPAGLKPDQLLHRLQARQSLIDEQFAKLPQGKVTGDAAINRPGLYLGFVLIDAKGEATVGIDTSRDHNEVVRLLLRGRQ